MSVLTRTSRAGLWTAGGKWTRGLSLSAQNQISFEDHRTAFASKNSWEIARALAVLKVCSYPNIVDNAEKWFELSRRLPLVRGVATALVRNTFYRQFVGGQQDAEVSALVSRMTSAGVRPMLVCTMEEDVGQNTGSFQEGLYDRNLERFLACLDLLGRVSTSNHPCIQLKMTSLFSPDALERLSQVYQSSKSKLSLVEPAAQCANGKKDLDLPGISLEDRKHLARGINRLAQIGKTLSSKEGTRLLVDAEFTYVNPALSLLCLALQAVFNTEQPIVWNTFQCYLKETQRNMLEERALTNALGVCFGAKLVRGAYMVTEKKRSEAMGQPNPVCPSYQDTNTNYDRCLNNLVDMVKESGTRCAFVAATHNENSVRLLITRMTEEGLKPETESINFAQLYGMCDQVTFPLGMGGYNVYKSIPVGPLDEAIPYLARRATENQSVLAGARKEHQMLGSELRRRMKIKTAH